MNKACLVLTHSTVLFIRTVDFVNQVAQVPIWGSQSCLELPVNHIPSRNVVHRWFISCQKKNMHMCSDSHLSRCDSLHCMSVMIIIRYFYGCRHGHRVSSVRSATWRSATHQRSALTTTRRMLRAAVDPSVLTPDTSATFAAGSLQRSAASSVTLMPFMAMVTSRPSNAASAQKSSI